VEDPIEKKAILERMVRKYVPPTFPFPQVKEQNVEATAVVRIVIESMKGKAHEPSPSHTVLPTIST
jgi:nitroimidazol reductase NimA-like FMN-containing flavoprotein (pyridoxamine 5'-phosphate oxidase superfamily)